MTRRKMGPERPIAVVMFVGAIIVGGARWTNGYELTGWEIVARSVSGLFALICLWGAVELWRMGGER